MDKRCVRVLVYHFDEHTHFCHVPKSETIHALYQFTAQSVLAQQRYKYDCLLVGLG